MGISTLFTSFWAFWGIIENFHEGWYYESLLPNIGLMILQYLSPMLIFMAVALVSIVKPRIGSGLHGLAGIFAIWFFHAYSNAATFLLVLPIFGLGILYWLGRPQPKKAAILLSIGVPLLTLIVSGFAPALRVSQRVNDGNLQSVQVQGNGVELIWAPVGPGWPKEGEDWFEAQRVCSHLSEDGIQLESTPQNIWRLSTIDEAVRSMTLHGQNCGGVWNADSAEAAYEIRPDKESPLWNIHSQVIYWWTASEVDQDHAYMIVYDGMVWSRPKDFGPSYLGFRCVKSP